MELGAFSVSLAVKDTEASRRFYERLGFEASGWDGAANPLGSFTDIRELQRQLKAQGMAFVAEVDEAGAGPGSFVLEDPDGNPIIIDQHV